ncbi:YhcN/YlaJ family sporulation lipoprotein [Tumebacillus sp. DT12]|uniref:YhcN/YlaJ family sporulation lipoprotein n=1 Tax=Tumebacillus lacus TaxID=2995335 RepID=A0ABT3WZ09_9BACL|nr:YhcN/YlaJ family sporulation lipoprotein [Tumebacillus lacus]MCX7569897.1 YhcN/YlaJ family sporulation lipoprotein [Tumebacillus lacus]
MRAMKTIALGLAVVMLSATLSGCGVMRTPYERAKIQEQGGTAKKKEEGGEAKGGEGGKGSDVTSASAGPKQKAEAKKKAEDKKPSTPGRAETMAEKRERVKGQGLIYVLPDMRPEPNVAGTAEDKPKALPKPKSNYKAESQNKLKPGPSETLTAKDKPEKILADQKPHLLYNAYISGEVSKVEGVESSTVLIDDEHNAYVSLSTGNEKKSESGEKPPVKKNESLKVRSEGEIQEDLQEKVATKVRSLDPLVETVHITNNPEHVKSFSRYATQITKGDINLNTHALAEHIQDIWN